MEHSEKTDHSGKCYSRIRGRKFSAEVQLFRHQNPSKKGNGIAGKGM